MHLGNLISNYRSEHHLSMDEFARKSGLSKPYISMLEKNRNSRSGKPIIPSVDTIKKVANAMDTTFDIVIRQIDGNQPIAIESNDTANSPREIFETSSDEQTMIKKYRCLDDNGKTMIDGALDNLYQKTIQSRIKDESAG